MTEQQITKIIKFFKSYCDFFYIENQVSLIDGRDNSTILVFLKEFEKLLFKPSQSNLDNVINVCNIYVEDMNRDYGTLSYGSRCIFEDKLSHQIIYDTFKSDDDEFLNYMEVFFDAYEQLSLFYGDDTHKVLLIEFNNCLAHLLTAFSDITSPSSSKNIDRAKAHIYRGSLDAYKEIIADEAYRGNKEKYYIDPIIKKDLFTLRMKEITSLGQSVNGKIAIVKDYASIATRIINEPDI